MDVPAECFFTRYRCKKARDFFELLARMDCLYPPTVGRHHDVLYMHVTSLNTKLVSRRRFAPRSARCDQFLGHIVRIYGQIVDKKLKAKRVANDQI